MKECFQFKARTLLQVFGGLVLVGMLVSACAFPGSSIPSNSVIPSPTHGSVAGHGVTPVANNGTRVVGSTPSGLGNLPGGIPLPGGEIKPLTFNLIYNDASMEQDIARIYTPGSSTYHQYLTADDIVQRYAVSDNQLNTVENWLTQNGYTVLSVDPLRSGISVQASVAAIEKSLNVKMQAFNVSGHEFFMQVGLPSLSGQVAGLVQSVVGLDNFAFPFFKPPFGSLQGATTGTDCTKYGAKLNLTADRMASAYGIKTLYQQGYKGQGMSIGVAEFDEPYDPKDIASYATCAGLAKPQIQNVTVDGPTAAGAGEGEATLDLEMIAGLAPQAQILDYQVGTNNNSIGFAQALIDMLTRVALDHKVQVLSISYGTADSGMSNSEQDAVNRALRTLAGEGISVFISSGDCGAFDQRVTNIATVDFPASAPYAIAVGGTHLQVNASNQRTSEDVWGGDSSDLVCQNDWGSGGGVSQNSDFKRPSWQVGPGTTSHYDGTSGFVLTASLSPVVAPNGLRQVPDVSAAAFPNISVYYQGAWHIFGGTSAAAPIWAAGALLVDQALQHQGKTPLGGVPTFYALANHSGQFHPYTDITRGNNLFYPATPGWDYSTGWGSPNFNDIVQQELVL